MICSPIDSRTTGGPAVNTEAWALITVKSDMGATSAPWPAEAPRMAVTSGTRPEQRAWASRSVGVRGWDCAIGPEACTFEHHHQRYSIGHRHLGHAVPLGVGRRTDRAGEHGEVLSRNHDRTPIDGPRADDHRVSRGVGPAHQGADLQEGPGVEQVVYPGPGVELAGIVVPFQALLPTHGP